MTQEPQFDMSENFPCVPYGRIEPATRYRQTSKQAADLGTLPVLSGLFNSARAERSTKAPMHLGFGSMEMERDSLPLLTFRLQVGADMMYWLANAGDPEIWAMLDAWHKAGRMAVAAEFEDGKVLFSSRDFRMVPPLQALRPKSADSSSLSSAAQDFAMNAGGTLVSGHLALVATSDIPTIPRLKSVQGCTVTTMTTGRVFVPPHIAALAACDLIAPEADANPLSSEQTVH
jgi:hypothetical protein